MIWPALPAWAVALATEGNALVDAAQGFVVPVVGAAAGGYALLRIARQDQNWDGLIDGLKSENKRKDEEIESQRETISRMTSRLSDLAAWEHEKNSVEKSLNTEREARKRALERLSAKSIELARLQGALDAAGIDPKKFTKDLEEVAPYGKPSPTDPIGVLLLDDDPLSSQLVMDSMLLKRPTWNIRRVASVEEAMETDLHGIDVVVSDWNMPGGENAGSYISWLKLNHPTKFIVVLSGHEADFLQEKMKKEGLENVMTLQKLEEARTGLRGLLGFIDNTRM